MEELIYRHKKELKELQAAIQALKKSVTKGDKRKKKEIDTLIKQKGDDLAKKHQEEKSAFEADGLVIKKENGFANFFFMYLLPKLGPPTVFYDEVKYIEKRARAQRRKEKKIMKQLEEMKLMEENCRSLIDHREEELSLLDSQLVVLKRKVYEVPADGNCLFSAIAHQLHINHIKPRGIAESAKTLRSNKERFLPFMHSETGEVLTEEEFDEYCYKLSHTNEWGGQLEIQALSESLHVAITVVQAARPPVSFGAGTASLYLVYFRKAFSLGEHYDSLVPV
ncbi:deubiquitinase OTUD6B-like isoform X2 [Zophobas morio]|uniref:deubiquitinase OTUD6B-like isoform X2 n=1 Tax=Zophobas morio TaxID=2755281 RepID=UPI003082A543